MEYFGRNLIGRSPGKNRILCLKDEAALRDRPALDDSEITGLFCRLYPVMPCPVMPCPVMRVQLCHVQLCCVQLCHVQLCHVQLCHVQLCHVQLCHVQLCHVQLCHVQLCCVQLCCVQLCCVQLCGHSMIKLITSFQFQLIFGACTHQVVFGLDNALSPIFITFGIINIKCDSPTDPVTNSCVIGPVNRIHGIL